MRQSTLHALAAAGAAAYAAVMLTIGLGLGGHRLPQPPQAFADAFEVQFRFLVPCIAATLLPASVGVAARTAFADAP